MLGTYEHALYSYWTPSPEAFFGPDGLLQEPVEARAEALRDVVRRVAGYLNGDFSYGRRWLGTDYLDGYDPLRFGTLVEEGVKGDIDIGALYSLIDDALRATRDGGQDSLFTVLETEMMHTPEYLRPMRQALPRAKVLVVLRDPEDQYASIKADILVRGPNEPSYGGQLSRRSNLMNIWVTSMQDSLDGLRETLRDDPAGSVLPLRFEELTGLDAAAADTIARFVLGDDHPERAPLAGHLERVSQPAAPLTSRYLKLERSSQSYFRPDRQQHLPKRFTSAERGAFMAWWERDLAKLHGPVHRELMGIPTAHPRLEAAAAFLRMPVVLVLSVISGLLEVRQGLGWRAAVRRRWFAQAVSWQAVRWMAPFYLRTLLHGRHAKDRSTA